MEVIKDQKQKKFCESENDGLKDLEVFLKQFKNCILLAIDKETIHVILDKFRKAKIGMEIKGFFTWPTILKKLLQNKVGTELEDFYSEFCNEEIKTYSTAQDVSSYLKKAFLKCVEMSIPSLNIVKTTKDLANDSKSENIPRNSDENDTIEVYNSFRPSVSTKMSAMKMDTLEISSDSETEEESRKISEPKQKVFTKQTPSSSKLKQQQQALLKMPSLPNGIQINRQTPKSSPFVNKNISLTRTGVSSPRIKRAVPTNSNANT